MRPDLLNRSVTLLDAVTIAAAAANVLSEVFTDLPSVAAATFHVNFAYGSGGTKLTVYVQTSFDRGVTWVDIACATFTTAAARKIASLKITTVVAASVIPTDGAIADDAILDGVLGHAYRIKYTSTGTYAGATSLSVHASFQGAAL